MESNDLHIRQTGSEQKLLFAHLRMADEFSDNEAVIRSAQEVMFHKYGINHTKLQILTFLAGEMEHCSHCN